MASEDLPSMVDYITGITGLEKISFVGHGTGATIFTMSSFVKKGFVDKVRDAATETKKKKLINKNSKFILL